MLENGHLLQQWKYMRVTELYSLSEVNFIILKLQTNGRKGAWMVGSRMSSVSGCFL